MIWELIASILGQFGETLLKLAPYVIAAGVIFPVLSWRFACNPAKPWWRSPDLVTDLAYWFVFIRGTQMRVLEQLANGVAVELVDRAVKVIVDGHRAEAPPAIIPRLPGGCISRASEQWKSRWCG